MKIENAYKNKKMIAMMEKKIEKEKRIFNEMLHIPRCPIHH